jgi:periplasmic copper chaperone A
LCDVGHPIPGDAPSSSTQESLVSRQVVTPRTAGRGLALAAGLMAVGAVAAPASAHVTVTPSTTEAGASAMVQVSIGHGCEGSATTAVQIRIPESVLSVTPTRNPLWDITVENEPVVPPATDEHGTRITDRVASITYRTDTPLPEGQRDTFELSLRLPAEVGTTLVFPTIQTCEKGEAAWIEVPAEGDDADDLSLPAPSFVITATGAPSSAAEVELVTHDKSSSSSGSSMLALGALGVAVVGVLLGIVALTRLRRRP